MKLAIKSENDYVQINHEESKLFDFDINGTVELNKFIKYVSESQEIIECNPVSFDYFKAEDPEIGDESLKLVEYIFKIIDAFNTSYSEIYAEV